MRVLVVRFLQVVLYGFAFFVGLQAVGFNLTGLAVLSGAIGVGIGAVVSRKGGAWMVALDWVWATPVGLLKTPPIVGQDAHPIGGCRGW